MHDADDRTTSDRPEPATGTVSRGTGTVSRRAVLSTVAATSTLGALSSGAASGRRRDAAPADAADPPSAGAVQGGGRLEYVAKVLCGRSDGEVVAPGQYWTAINVHNPQEEAFQFIWKVAVAGPREPGPISEFDGIQLEPDEAFELDCPHLREQAGVDRRLLKGFLVLRTVVELDVVAVYTAAGADGTVRTMDVVEVQPDERGRGDAEEGMADLVPELVRCGGEIVVRVTNRGSAPAESSVTMVDFGDGDVQTAETPGLDPGESTTHAFVPEVGCFDPDCTFTVTVDANRAVEESNEDNNVREEFCLG